MAMFIAFGMFTRGYVPTCELSVTMVALWYIWLEYRTLEFDEPNNDAHGVRGKSLWWSSRLLDGIPCNQTRQWKTLPFTDDLQNPEKHPIYRGSFPYVPLFSHIFPAISPFLKIGISQHRHPRHHVATVATARLQQETFQLFRTQHVTLMIRGLAQTDRSYT